MYVQAAMAAASMLSSHNQQKKQMAAAANDAKLQRAKLEQARLRQAGDYAINTQRLREAAQKRDIQIESQRIKAESKIDEAFAGSGISGTSVDELDNEINAEVSKNKYEGTKALDQQLSDTARSDQHKAQDINAQAMNIGASAKSGGFLEQAMTGAQGFSAGAQLNSVGGDINASINKALGL